MKDRSVVRAGNVIAFAPGHYLRELIGRRPGAVRDFSERSGLPEDELRALLMGQAPVTEETAGILSRVLGTSAGLWINLEARYRERLAEIRRIREEKKRNPGQ